jgi:beta-fructofuranosidase
MSRDRHRPAYHFSPDQWMNDPIPFFWEGEHHIFFQHNPNGAFWGTMHWGHAASRDLVHWTELPIALAPTPGGPDQDGCFTGCVVEDGGQFHILYTGIPRLSPLKQVQCLASSRDLVSWEKPPGNPVIAEPPPGFGECFCDPCAWKEGDEWQMVIGSELPERRGGAALLYRSPDLLRWEYRHPLFTGEIEHTGHEFECPDFFSLGDRHVLLTSSGKTHWHIGRYDGERFALEGRGLTDGGAYYAAKTSVDDRGRRTLWGWVQERRPDAEQRAAGWSGVLSLPRVLSLRPDGQLGMEPAPELEALRGRHWGFRDLTPRPPSLQGKGETEAGEGLLFLEGVEGDTLEVLIRFGATDATVFGAVVRCSPDGAERAEVVVDRAAQRLGDAALEVAAGEELILRIFVDRSVIEAFAGGRACQTLRFYPERDDCLRVALFARGGGARVKSVDVWELRPTRSG